MWGSMGFIFSVVEKARSLYLGRAEGAGTWKRKEPENQG